jgi:putative protein-disulfide isomerase
MNSSVLHYIYDPLCGWCYAATPLVNMAAEAGVAMRLHAGGLWTTPTWLSREQRQHIAFNDARIAELAQVPFGAVYLDQLGGDTPFFLYSNPVVTAITAVGAINPGADLDLLHAVQHAHYVEGRRVTEPPILAGLAGQLGISESDFSRACNAVDLNALYQDAAVLMRRFKLLGYPSFILERNGQLMPIHHEQFYGNPVGFVEELGFAV